MVKESLWINFTNIFSIKESCKRMNLADYHNENIKYTIVHFVYRHKMYVIKIQNFFPESETHKPEISVLFGERKVCRMEL